MMLCLLLAIPALIGLASATTGNEYRAACEAVETVISKESNVYYPGGHELL